MKFLKSHFALSRSQQNGIFILVIIIVALQLLIFNIDIFSSEEEISEKERDELEIFRNRLDSLKRIQFVKRDTIYPFNPNYITDFKGYQLGMSLEEIDRLLNYRKANKWINSKEDFQKVTGVSDSLLKAISLYFKFPDWIRNENFPTLDKSIRFSPSKEVKKIKVSDLNNATAEDLMQINGIGEVLSSRIVKYRNSIKGFRSLIQLKDVYGLKPEVITEISKSFEVVPEPDATIRNINLLSQEELTEIPYFSYELAGKIVSFRKLREGISGFDELSKINGFPSDKIDRIKLYLTIE